VIASVLIIIVSGVLFVYWFRYTCLLILNTKTARDYAKDIAAANQLSFLEARATLAGSVAKLEKLDQVHESLDRDYELVTYLLDHAARYSAVKDPIEHWILRFDFRLMTIGYRVTRGFSKRVARAALLEMTSIVGHLANSMGERVAVSAGA
jgi:hypothetical protein